ncbi:MULTISPECIES: GNAT family protein [unclassified Breznakia]|uniref:GNAT family N-acetyltransferase n=1 Tax=unclassified Breznakia TaxID=2623764 RepID=UPI0024771E59|nr:MULTISPECIES: GNAT family protein [unclassified Breznakia]MDH6365987.1 ribosomal-protein-alanine N-acetyltransferase [Breznakia sp. PH1-1]MDH6403081.1 ribosomal-protein-alanine N-acetyltransferase [Breznakia sp. PF1-11]MDH6410790.1 ribosomal-protein-alanine N-acetyltransferase [Breznakia sp. PFB1-11]MDH6413153.1 ribosomal-protein-alanine N-acetyltransferase [Breznakia sp. PFB1-14]MDH6415521.1 ribosomal-protein-alanine N-acetyltransferase [Breznakia sp. PFB1-4]
MNEGKFTIRFLSVNDIDQLVEFETYNKENFEKFNPTKPDSFFTREGQEMRMEHVLALRMSDLAYSYGIFVEDELIGTFDVFQVERGAMQNAWIGYCIDQDYQHLGYATAAMKQIIQLAFSQLQLHRLEAWVMPSNEQSIHLLERCGFEKIGLAKRSIYVHGAWQDHLIYALCNEHYGQ